MPEGTDAAAREAWFRTGNKPKGRDGCRVPLPWDAQETHLGFGGSPWLPQPGWFADHAVSALARRRRLQTAESLQWVSVPGAAAVTVP